MTLEAIEKDYIIKHYQYIDKYIFISKYVEQIHTTKRKFFQKAQCAQIYNFVYDADKLTPNNKKGSYFLYYGRITKEKGVNTFIEATKLLPEYSFKMAGTGVLENELKQKAGPNVEFLGFKKNEELYDLIRNASFVIVPSEWQEAMGLVVVESMFLGKPVIGSRIGGITELITEGKNGFLFKQGDVKALADTIKKANTMNDADYLEMSNFACTFAKCHFTPEKYYARLMEVYQEVIERKHTLKNENI
jgi:glycosyltransferase involved in cell wall biosynthesis